MFLVFLFILVGQLFLLLLVHESKPPTTTSSLLPSSQKLVQPVKRRLQLFPLQENRDQIRASHARGLSRWPSLIKLQSSQPTKLQSNEKIPKDEIEWIQPKETKSTKIYSQLEIPDLIEFYWCRWNNVQAKENQCHLHRISDGPDNYYYVQHPNTKAYCMRMYIGIEDKLFEIFYTENFYSPTQFLIHWFTYSVTNPFSTNIQMVGKIDIPIYDVDNDRLQQVNCSNNRGSHHTVSDPDPTSQS